MHTINTRTEAQIHTHTQLDSLTHIYTHSHTLTYTHHVYNTHHAHPRSDKQMIFIPVTSKLAPHAKAARRNALFHCIPAGATFACPTTLPPSPLPPLWPWELNSWHCCLRYDINQIWHALKFARCLERLPWKLTAKRFPLTWHMTYLPPHHLLHAHLCDALRIIKCLPQCFMPYL